MPENVKVYGEMRTRGGGNDFFSFWQLDSMLVSGNRLILGNQRKDGYTVYSVLCNCKSPVTQRQLVTAANTNTHLRDIHSDTVKRNGVSTAFDMSPADDYSSVAVWRRVPVT